MVKVGDVVDFVHNEHPETQDSQYKVGDELRIKKVRKDNGVPDLHVPMIVCAVTASREIGPDGVNAITVQIVDGYVFLPDKLTYKTGVRPGAPGDVGCYHERD